MPDTTPSIVSKVWGMCNPLRDDGVSYQDYLEQLTYMIFLKMSDEYSRPPYNRETGIPAGCGWADMNGLTGAALEEKYKEILDTLGKKTGILGEIFMQATNKISNAAILYRVVQMIDKEKWVSMSSDVKGEIYEGLLQKNAEDIKSGAGQYFTPRPLIRAMVRCLRPRPGETVADPCCGSGGFFLATQEYLTDPANYPSLDREQQQFIKNDTFYGTELVRVPYKLCLMNLFLHNIGDIYGRMPVTRGDALLSDPGYRVDCVLTNPPFGKKSSLTFTNEEGEQEEEDLVYNRQDFCATTSNKQLNFLQHINTLLKADGRAAVVLPDNVLFEGGAGETVRKKLLETCELHTILRLPTGIFYKPGVKANVLFFDRKPASPQMQTKEIWVYDFRTNIHFTLKQNPMRDADLEDFVRCYHPENRFDRHETWSEDNPDGRWRRFPVDFFLKRDKTSFDYFWIKDKALADLDNLPDPDVLAADIIENLQSALDSFKELQAQLNKAKV
jgi:type I restriction enzyme M protein